MPNNTDYLEQYNPELIMAQPPADPNTRLNSQVDFRLFTPYDFESSRQRQEPNNSDVIQSDNPERQTRSRVTRQNALPIDEEVSSPAQIRRNNP